MPDLPAKHLTNDTPLFYPVLRNYQPGDVLASAIVGAPITDGLGVFACRKLPRPEGRVGLDYITYADLETYGVSGQRVLELAYENFFRDHIGVDVRSQNTAKLFHFTSSSHLVGALMGYPTTYEKFAGLVGTSTLVVLVTGAELLVTAAGSPFEAGLHTIASGLLAESTAPADVTPGVYYWSAERKLVAAAAWQAEHPPRG